VSFRILQRTADILQHRFDEEELDPFRNEAKIFEYLWDYSARRLKHRKLRERSSWEDPDPIHHKYVMSHYPDEFRIQHDCFTEKNGIQIFHMFLTKKLPRVEQYLKKVSDESFQKPSTKFKKELQTMTKDKEFKEKQKRRQEEEKQKQALGQNMAEFQKGEDDQKGVNILKMALQQEELGSEYDETLVPDQLLQGASGKQVNIENIAKKDFYKGVENLKIRSLCIAAFLRCLHAAIEYAPDSEMSSRAIEQL